MSGEPSDDTQYARWISQEDVLPFLQLDLGGSHIVLYASLPHVYLHAILVPEFQPTDDLIGEMLDWNFNACDAWSLTISSDDVSIRKPLGDVRSALVRCGEKILFIRSSDVCAGGKPYVEMSQKLTHVLDLHHVPERRGWCKLDDAGDITDIVKVFPLSGLQGNESGTVVLMERNAIEEYMAVAGFCLLRTFDFTRYRATDFWGWQDADNRSALGDGKSIFGTLTKSGNQASYSRGIQIGTPRSSKREYIDRFWKHANAGEEKQYATFVAYDWKNKRVADISCAPSALANYFTQSDLPYEVTPAFFKPDVLLKYKSNSDKYEITDRTISCRGSWSLTTFDINSAGQVHTYLIYLGRLPYEEQLHWKQFNEEPKAGLSPRAITTDFDGEFYEEYDPLPSLKHRMDKLHRRNVDWWKLRDERLLSKLNYPFTESRDEWADELMNLDKFIIEGLEERWLRRRAKELGRDPDDRLRGLKLVEQCLIGLGFEEDHAAKILSPLHDVHNLRSQTKGHASGSTAVDCARKAIADFGSLRSHFRHLCTECDESLQIIIRAFDSVSGPVDA